MLVVQHAHGTLTSSWLPEVVNVLVTGRENRSGSLVKTDRNGQKKLLLNRTDFAYLLHMRWETWNVKDMIYVATLDWVQVHVEQAKETHLVRPYSWTQSKGLLLSGMKVSNVSQNKTKAGHTLYIHSPQRSSQRDWRERIEMSDAPGKTRNK